MKTGTKQWMSGRLLYPLISVSILVCVLPLIGYLGIKDRLSEYPRDTRMTRQLAQQQQLELYYTHRVADVLSPLLNPSDFRVQVHATLDVPESARVPASLQRLSVALLINQAQALESADQTRLIRLIRQTIGFDVARGDQLTITHLAFAHTGRIFFQSSRWMKPYGRVAVWLGGLLLLVLTAVVVRYGWRVYRQDRPGDCDSTVTAFAPYTALKEPIPPATATPAYRDHRDRIEEARQLVTEDAAQVAQVVKLWIASDG